MKKYFIYLFCLIFSTANLFAYDYYNYNEALAEAKRLASPLITKKERELNAQNISKEQKEYILDCYRIDAITEKLTELDLSQALSIEHARYLYNSYDILLNKYYKLYRNLLNSECKKALQTEEIAWLKLRDIYQDEYVSLVFDHALEQPDSIIIFELIFKSIFGINYDSASAIKLGSIVLGMFCKAGFVAMRTEELFNYYWDYKQRGIIVNRADSYQDTWGGFDHSEVPYYIISTEKKLENTYKEYLITKRRHIRTVNGY